MDRKTLAVCGAVAGGVIGVVGAGVFAWKWFKRHHHGHGHGHWPGGDMDFTAIWLGNQYCDRSKYISFSFIPQEMLEFYPRIVNLCNKHKRDDVLSRALEVGCATGVTTFKLAETFDEVVGIDISEDFLGSARKLKEGKAVPYELVVEGEIKEKYEAILDPKIDTSRVTLMNVDACKLPSDFGQFGLVLIVNTLHHLPNPRQFLDDMKQRIVPGGLLVIVEIYRWDEMFKLPKDQWIAGYTKDNGEFVTGFAGLKEVLLSHFELVEEDEYPAVLRFTSRFYFLTVGHATVWRRNN